MFFRKKTKIKRPLFRRIINYFVGFGVGLFIILLILFGYTQTSSFRNWLREFAVEQVNSATNGKLSIGRIDGTIFTSLILSNTVYTLEEDTVFSADKLEIKFSPLRIFLKTIYFRKLDIENANISLLKDENGVLNVSKISKPSDKVEIEDSTKVSEPFGWKIDVADLELKNINFSVQTIANKNSNAKYPQPSMDDLRLNNINLSLSTVINIASNEYELYISRFSAEPNLEGFKLNNLSGNFILLNDIAGVRDLKIETDRSNISLNAAVSDFSIFGDEGIDIKNSPIKLEMDAVNFSFDDLTNFISGTDLLEGDVETHLTAEGTLNDLYLDKLQIKFNETNLDSKVHLQNVLGGTEMRINARFTNSFINQDDVKTLLPTIGIPTYPGYGVLQFDSLYFDGKPLVFDAGMNLKTDQGGVQGIIKMDLSGDQIVYDYKIKTSNLNLEPVAGIKTNLNLDGTLAGTVFSPATLQTEIAVNAVNSSVGDISFKELSVNTNGSDGIIRSDVSFVSLETRGNVNTIFNFTDSLNTRYSFDAGFYGFNIDDFVKETGFTSLLNLKLKGDGENFNQDRLNLFAVIEIDSSMVNDIAIDSTTMIVDIRRGEDNRVINIISDLADITVTGSFTLSEMIEVISDEVSLVSAAIQDKIEKIQPPSFKAPVSQNLVVATDQKEIILPEDLDLNIDYLLEFKSFELLSLFMGKSDIKIDGEILGKIKATSDSVSIALETNIDEMKYWDGQDLYYISGFKLELEMDDRIRSDSFDDFLADVKISSERIFLGSDIKDLNFELMFNNNSADFNLNAEYDEAMGLQLGGSFDINDSFVDVAINNLLFKYNEFDLQNSGDIRFAYSNDRFDFESFKVVHNGGEINLNGGFSFTGDEDLTLKISKFNIDDIGTNLLGLPRDKTLTGDLNLDLNLTGNAADPEISITSLLDSLKAQTIFLGSIESEAVYSGKLLNASLQFLETKNLQQRKSLVLSGEFPIDLSFNSEKKIIEDKSINLNFTADNFDLRVITGLVPGISNPTGYMNGNVNLSGTFDNISSTGNLSIDNSTFIMELVNLTYLLDAKVKFENDRVVLSNLSLRNEPDIKNGGIITAAGEIDHHNFEINKIDMRASGELKLLDEKTRTSDPTISGDITIKTRNDIIFSSTAERSYLSADLILKDGASITYSPTQSVYSDESDKFRYVFVSDAAMDQKKKEIDSLIKVSEQIKKDSAANVPFDLDLKIALEDEAKMVFVLSREFKQNLTAYLGGNFEYSIIDDVPAARGDLTLLDGSKLDFIKTFQASGSVKFLDELDNPYMNILATYESFYSPDTLRSGANEQDVQIRIRYDGPAKNLTTGFLTDESNIEVWKRRRNYGQYELDASKTSSDAMFFIIVNKFPEDASLQETNLAASTAASVAGSIVGALLNEKLGNVVRSVNVQQVGSETRISLIGKVEEFRYEIGGTSQVFQDLSRANVKIERPIFFPSLIIRFDRREPPYQSSTFSEMINELGLKYSFVF